ncbi:PucR family transcriptional regulator [Mycolicibacterium moriokaense]|nr:PucR family transcriptional regulator [Mycolicibacterium moriokaense]
MALTLREVLAHHVLQSADPKMLSGNDHLDQTVRWVHTADLYDIAPLLRGGEVLLTNGVGLIGVDEAALALYVQRLAESGVAALFFEIGRTFSAVPPVMIAKARDVGLPVVELQPTLRFTEVAEAINSELIDRSVARLRHADEISRALSEALARGSSLGDLIEQVAETLGTWARLSDYAGRVVTASRDCPPVEEGQRTEVTVLVEGTAWGRLCVGTAGPSELLVEAVLERAPTVLGLCLIREQKDVAGALRAQHILLEQLMANLNVDRSALVARLGAAGIACTNHEYVCICVDPQRVPSAAEIVDGLVRNAGHGIFALVDGALCGLLAGHLDGVSLNFADSVRRAATEVLPVRSQLCMTVSRVVTDLEGLPRAMADTRDTLLLGQDLHVHEPVVSVQALALERLLAAHGNVDAIQQFVDDQIGILGAVDSSKGSQLLSTLEVFIACAGSKSEAAKRLHIRRQSLYYRLDQIARLTDIDLNDPKQLMTLSVAVTARRTVLMDR